MISFNKCILSVVVTVIVFVFLGEAVKIDLAPEVKINPIHGTLQKSSEGVVKGTRSRGGNGQVIQWRYESCKDSDTPCHAPADNAMKKAEVDFIPSRDVESLGLRLKALSNDGEIKTEFNFEDPIYNASVKKGEKFTITNFGGVSEELKGKRAIFQYILYDKMNDQVEICAESDFQYV